jgi:thiosulfate/3-mercaptopyruvate sulfurtransferase
MRGIVACALRRVDHADLASVRDHLDDPQVAFVATRSRSMYSGSSGPTQRRGHIPGAILHNYIWDFQRDGCYKPLERLRLRYEQAGITPDKEIITYCVTGREGSAAWFMLKVLLDYPRVRLYQASMTEWAAHAELPMVMGNAPYGERKVA